MAVDMLGADNGPFSASGSPQPRRGRSMFGKQADSRKPTSPMHTFTASTNREQASKVFLSSAHVAVDMKGRTSPGAIYRLPNCMDKQVEAQKATAPQFAFSQLERDGIRPASVPPPGSYTMPGSMGPQAESSKSSPPRFGFARSTREQAGKVFRSNRALAGQLGTAGPDPGSYVIPSAVGPQASSMKRSMPSFGMGKPGDRLKQDYERLSQTLPPVGKYETWASIGKQPLSKFATLPSWGFGTSTWDKEERRYLTSGHSRELRGRASPANFDHQQQNTLSGFGRQALSNKQSSSSFGFGASQKLVFKTSNTPGPGAYD